MRATPLVLLLAATLLSGCTNPDAPRTMHTQPAKVSPQNAGETPAPAPPFTSAQAPADVQPTPARALAAFAHLYTNWSFRTLSTDQQTLAGMSVGAARLSEREAAASSRDDTTIARGRIYNHGEIVSIARDLARSESCDTQVAGSQSITFSGSDAGSGIRSARLTLSPLNGAAPYVHTFDFSGECPYDSWNACPLTETVSGFAVDTDALADGAYAVSLAITDAAGNVANDALGSITVSNAGGTVSSLGALPGSGAVSSHNGSTGGGSPNGIGASEGAHLQLGARSPISRTYARRAVRITGRLLDAQGLPIAGASLDVLQQVGGGTLELIGRARTGANGTFVASVPAGPSRMVEIGYRAFSGDVDYSARAKLVESVDAGVQLRVSPRRTGAEGTIALSGRVLGPIPPQGVVVELLVHYRGHWEPFRDPRTDSRGRFRVVYQFEGGIGRFPFRALVFGRQGGFPFVLGESRAVDVTTN